MVELSQQPLPYSLLPVCPSRENKVEMKTEAASKRDRSYKLSSVKVGKVSGGCPTLCLHKPVIRKGFAGSQYKVFLGESQSCQSMSQSLRAGTSIPASSLPQILRLRKQRPGSTAGGGGSGPAALGEVWTPPNEDTGLQPHHTFTKGGAMHMALP